MESVKLNLGCGNTSISGYRNLDRKDGFEAYPLNVENETVDEIRASHLLEHFEEYRVQAVLDDWVSKLKDGGVLKIAVPDFNKISQNYLNGIPQNTAGYILGGQTNSDDFHKSIFDENKLTSMMEKEGLTDIQKWQSEIADCASLPISLNLMGAKRSPRSHEEKEEISMDDLRKANMEIAEHKSNTYSQGGEDGIIEEIFNRIGTNNKWCFEAGAGDGIFCSNTRRLVEKYWQTVLVEKDKEKYRKLVENSNMFNNTMRLNEELLPHGLTSIENLLIMCSAPKDIDFVSIDIDGQDYHIFNSMLEYRPRVICIEFALENDPARFRGYDYIPPIDGDGQAGAGAILKLAAAKNYIPVVQTGTNLIFVRFEDAHKLIKSESAATTAIAEKTAADNKTATDNTPVKIEAVMSMPRLAFSDNMFCTISGLVMSLGINIKKGSGVFWGQVLTRMMNQHLNDGTDFIITVDYDTWFTKNHIIKLMQIMQENPQIDAIVPLQVKRENDLVMFSKVDENGKPIGLVPAEEFYKEFTPIVNGHFGLTIFRVSALRKLRKPWFVGVPDANGGWDDGRMDEDIYFWQNFYKSGCRAYLAPEVKIGHIQLMVTFAGEAVNNFKPVNAYITDVQDGKVPAGMIPKVEMLK
jgi:predicted SAM-dependent methyltransferase